MTQPRSTPASEDAEQGILCSALLDLPRTMEACAEAGVTRSYFHQSSHAELFEAIAEFWHENEPIDIITLTQVMRERGKLDKLHGRINGASATGAALISELFMLLPTAANVGAYISTVRKKAIARQIITECTRITEKALNESEDEAGLFSAAEASLLKIVKMNEGQKTHSRDIKELVFRANASIDAALHGDGKIDMPTGLKDLDFHTGGFRAPEVTLIAAKPSDGKTAVALNIAEELAVRNGKRVGIISLEMSDDQLTTRLLAAMSWTNIRAIKRDREISDEDVRKIHGASNRIATSKIFIRDDGQLSMTEIGATMSAWKSKHGLDFGIIDHAQLIRGDGTTRGRTEEMEQISRSLKPLAKRLEIPLLVLSQITENDRGEYRTKNSTALQEDADNVLTLSHKDGASWIHIGKQRDGERNVSIPVTYIPHLMRFTSKAPKDDDQPDLPPAGKSKRK